MLQNSSLFGLNEFAFLDPGALSVQIGHEQIEPLLKRGSRVLVVESRPNYCKVLKERYQHDSRVTVVSEENTLDRLIAVCGQPRYVRINVEGGELQALAGLTQPIPYLSFHCSYATRDGTCLALAHLMEIGYRKFNLFVPAISQVVCFKEWARADEIVTYLTSVSALNFRGIVLACY